MPPKTFKPVQRFNDHGSGCKGHANFMLDCTYENKEDRDLLHTILGNYTNSDEQKRKIENNNRARIQKALPNKTV